MQPFSGNQRPDLLYNMFESRVSCTAPATRNAIADPGQTPRTCHRCWNCCKARSFGSLLARCISIAPATRNEASTSVVFFYHFDFEMCFVPQLCALFQHLNFQKCFEAEAFCTFLLRNVLRATTAWTFSTSHLPKVLRGWGVFEGRAHFWHLNIQNWTRNGLTFSVPNVLRPATACAFSTSQLPQVLRGWGVFDILTSKHASRHNGVQLFLISHLPRWLCTCRFSESTFRPSGATKHWKNKVSRLFYCTFLRTFIFFLLALSLLWPLLSFFSLAAELSILSEFDF